MIGNGFDLSCGMKTKYCQVYKEYTKTKSDSDLITEFKNTIRNDYERWADFELAMAKHAASFKNESDFNDCVDDFNSFLVGYLENEEKKFFDTISEKEVIKSINEEVNESINTYFEGISDNISWLLKDKKTGISFISFNYTTTLDRLLNKAFGFPIIVHHIHGKLGSIAIGADNIDQCEVAFPITDSFKRHFIKPFFNQKFDERRMVKAIEMIEMADSICTYGLSLGETDLTWRKKIINWLSENENHQLIIYDYKLSKMSYKTTANRMDIEEEALKNKLCEWGVDNVEDYIDQIHIVCGRDIFNIEEVVETTINNKTE